MKNPFDPGSKKTYIKKVSEEDIAAFDSGVVHQVYATFSLARDAEWSGRLFVLDMLEDGEEGIGTMLTIEHVSPAFPGNEICFEATLERIEGNEIITSYKATVAGRLIGKGQQGQKIVSKAKLQHLFEQLHPNNS